MVYKITKKWHEGEEELETKYVKYFDDVIKSSEHIQELMESKEIGVIDDYKIEAMPNLSKIKMKDIEYMSVDDFIDLVNDTINAKVVKY